MLRPRLCACSTERSKFFQPTRMSLSLQSIGLGKSRLDSLMVASTWWPCWWKQRSCAATAPRRCLPDLMLGTSKPSLASSYLNVAMPAWMELEPILCGPTWSSAMGARFRVRASIHQSSASLLVGAAGAALVPRSDSLYQKSSVRRRSISVRRAFSK